MPRPAKAATPHKRNGFWYLVRRVPKEFVRVDDRGIIQLTTGIRVVDDPRGVAASKKVQELDADLVRFWREKRDGVDPDASNRYREALKKARTLGVPYLPAHDAAQLLALEAIVKRLEMLEARETVEVRQEVAAILGGEAPPVFMVADMAVEFEAINAAALKSKSPRQMHRWRVQRVTALNTFVEAISGNKPMSDLSRQDVLTFRQVLLDRVMAEEIEIDTANKAIGRVASMFRDIAESKQLDLKPIFDKASIRGGRDRQRTAYPPEFVQAHFLAEGVFDDLNEEARRCIFLIAETGLRLSEACNLNESTIILDHEIPHVLVRPDGREMKTDQSKREIPLVGVALEAMKLQPNGFPRYMDKGDSLSGLVNNALDARKLRPEVGQSLYSLRHTFEDRLTKVEAPEKVVANLMGHKWHRPLYGVGPSLAQKLEWLSRIAFRPPSRV